MTVADILAHLREHPEDARPVVEGLRKLVGPWGSDDGADRRRRGSPSAIGT